MTDMTDEKFQEMYRDLKSLSEEELEELKAEVKRRLRKEPTPNDRIAAALEEIAIQLQLLNKHLAIKN